MDRYLGEIFEGLVFGSGLLVVWVYEHLNVYFGVDKALKKATSGDFQVSV